MKKWIKYIAVVCCFLIMAGIFVPDFGSKVKASESGNEQGIEGQTEESTEEKTEESTEEHIEEQTEEPAEEQTEEPIEEPTEEPSTISIAFSFVLDGGTWVYGDNSTVELNNWTAIPGSGNIYYIGIPTPIPTKENFAFNGWKYTSSNIGSMGTGTAAAGQTIEIDGSKVSDGATITFTAQWLEIKPTDGNISAAGAYKLSPDVQYTLGDGKWTVSGDSGAIEYAGENTFYVETTGNYIFTKM